MNTRMYYVYRTKNGHKYRIDLFRLTACILYFIGGLLLAWAIISWLDVLLHNCTDQNFASWNFWTITLGRFIR